MIEQLRPPTDIPKDRPGSSKSRSGLWTVDLGKCFRFTAESLWEDLPWICETSETGLRVEAGADKFGIGSIGSGGTVWIEYNFLQQGAMSVGICCLG